MRGKRAIDKDVIVCLFGSNWAVSFLLLAVQLKSPSHRDGLLSFDTNTDTSVWSPCKKVDERSLLNAHTITEGGVWQRWLEWQHLLFHSILISALLSTHHKALVTFHLISAARDFKRALSLSHVSCSFHCRAYLTSHSKNVLSDKSCTVLMEEVFDNNKSYASMSVASKICMHVMRVFWSGCGAAELLKSNPSPPNWDIFALHFLCWTTLHQLPLPLPRKSSELVPWVGVGAESRPLALSMGCYWWSEVMDVPAVLPGTLRINQSG